MALDPSFYDDVMAQISGGAKEFNSGAGQLRDIVAKQEFQKQAPDLISEMNGQGIGLYSPAEARGQLALLASNANDPSMLRELIKNESKPKSLKAPLDKNQLGVLYKDLGPDQIDYLAQIQDPNLQANIAAGIRRSTETERSYNLQVSEEQRRRDEQKTKQVIDAIKTVNSSTEKLRTARDGIDKVLDQTSQGSLPSDRVLLLGIAKGVANDVGNIAAQEASAIVPNTAFKTFTEFMNYLSSDAASALSPKVKEKLVGVLRKARETTDRQVKERASKYLSEQINAKDKFAFKDGKLDPGLQTLAENEGLEVVPGKSGYKVQPIKTRSEITKSTVPGVNPETKKISLNGLSDKINKIKDPKIRNSALAKISAAQGQEVDPAKYKQMEDVIDDLLQKGK